MITKLTHLPPEYLAEMAGARSRGELWSQRREREEKAKGR